MHIGAKKGASKRPWVAGFVYLGRFRRSACPSLRLIGAVTCQRKQADEISENAHVWRWRSKAVSGQVEMGGALLSGGLRSFGLLHCGIRSRRHCGARMAAPGTAIVENERDGQHWGRHLPHGVTVAQLLGSNLESGDRARE